MTLLMQALKKQASKSVTASPNTQAKPANTVTSTPKVSYCQSEKRVPSSSIPPQINTPHVILRKQQMHQEALLYEWEGEDAITRRHQQNRQRNSTHRNGWMLKLAVCSFSISLLLGALMYQQIHTSTEVAVMADTSIPTNKITEETKKTEENFLAKRSSPFRNMESQKNTQLVSIAQVDNTTPTDVHFQKQQQERIDSLVIQGIAVLPQGGKIRIEGKVYSVGEFIHVQEENFLFKGIRNQQLIFSDRKGNIYQRSFQNKDL